MMIIFMIFIESFQYMIDFIPTDGKIGMEMDFI
jgi:hypothetical protein